MGVKVFVLGLPGSGKSTAVRYIDMIARDYGWATNLVNDYDILYKWFLAAPDGPQFSRIAFDGFNVLDIAVFDAALQELERQVLQEQTSSKQEMTIIEFARDDYLEAFKLFSASFLRDAYFLFVDAEIFICKERIRSRAIRQQSSDDHFVSDDIFNRYYYRGRDYYNISDLSGQQDSRGERYTIDPQRTIVVGNLSTTRQEVFGETVLSLAPTFIGQQSAEPQENDMTQCTASENHETPPDVNVHAGDVVGVS